MKLFFYFFFEYVVNDIVEFCFDFDVDYCVDYWYEVVVEEFVDVVSVLVLGLLYLVEEEVVVDCKFDEVDEDVVYFS